MSSRHRLCSGHAHLDEGFMQFGGFATELMQTSSPGRP
jgi:hypothetical protein